MDEKDKNTSVTNSWEKVGEKLNDTEFLKNVRTGIIFLIALGVPMLYFGFFSNITLSALLTWSMGALAFLTIALITAIRIDTKHRAFDDEIKNNKELNQVENDIQLEINKIDNHIAGHRFVKHYNKQQQALADEIATEKLKDKLERQKADYEIAGRFGAKYDKLCKRIKKLESHKIRGKYTPIEYDDLYSANEKKSKNSSQAKANLRYDPKKEGLLNNIGGIIVKGSAVGGAGAIPFMLNADIKTIFIFYATFFITIVWTVLSKYITTRLKTSKKYYSARKFKLQLLKSCNKYIAEHPVEKAIPKDDETQKKDIKPPNNIKEEFVDMIN